MLERLKTRQSEGSVKCIGHGEQVLYLWHAGDSLPTHLSSHRAQPQGPLDGEAWYWPVPDLSSFLVPRSLWPQLRLDPTPVADSDFVYRSLLWWKGLLTQRPWGWGGALQAVCHSLPQVRITSLPGLCPFRMKEKVTTTGWTRTATFRVPPGEDGAPRTCSPTCLSGAPGYIGA